MINFNLWIHIYACTIPYYYYKITMIKSLFENNFRNNFKISNIFLLFFPHRNQFLY